MATAKKEVFTALDVNCETGEITERELTANEIAELATAQSQDAIEETAKASARASALAKLGELGLTAEEIASL
jgi:hypothetical protein